MPFDKIAKYVQANNIKKFKYHTWRKFEQGKGEIRILVLEDGVARCEYICVKCGHHGYSESEWKRPFSTKCEKCSAKISVPKMRDQMKKEQKQRNAEAAAKKTNDASEDDDE